MRIFVLGMVLGAMGGAIGCATVEPFVPSAAQEARFEEVVRQAEAAGVSDGPRAAAAMLADAKSDWTYAQHLPKYPERAREVAAKAQREAETALMMARRTELPAPASPPVASGELVSAERPER